MDKAIRKAPVDFSAAVSSLILDLTALSSAIISQSTKREYEHAGVLRKSEGSMPFVETFLETLCKAGLMVVLSQFPNAYSEEPNKDWLFSETSR